jgi:hypothetical protein
MSNLCRYNPVPPRVWSRVQNRCTYTDNNISNLVFLTVPLTIENNVTLSQATYEAELLQKGNILQYKGNSSRITKKQRYAQLAKGFGPNRTKVFATQSQTYTNPNTTGLARVNSVEIPFPNNIVGQPNNISGPFQYNVDNPFGCSGVSLQDGGNLVCGTYTDPCSGQIIKTANTSATICNPASASGVPGSTTLCWNKTVQTWFPRNRYTMSNSGTNWPQGYKGFVSAIKPAPPTISIYGITSGILQVLIMPNNNYYYQSFNFNIYIDGVPYDNILNISKDGLIYNIIYDPPTAKGNTISNSETTKQSLFNNNKKTDTTQTNGYTDERDTTINNILLPKLYETNQLMSSIQSTLVTILSSENNTQTELQPVPVITKYINNLNTKISRKFGLQSVDSSTKSLNEIYSKYTVHSSKFTILINSVIKTRNTTYESDQTNENIIHFDHANYYYDEGNCVDNCDGGVVEQLPCDYITYNKLVTSKEFTYVNEQMKYIINTKDKSSNYQINIDDFNNINVQLQNIKKMIDPHCYFYNMIDLYMNIWKTIYFSFTTKNNMSAIEFNSEKWRQDSIILNDVDLLKKYLSEIQNTLNFPNVSIETNLAKIKPQYIIYHNLYGLPEDFEYDAEKMSNILAELNV